MPAIFHRIRYWKTYNKIYDLAVKHEWKTAYELATKINHPQKADIALAYVLQLYAKTWRDIENVE